ncbi:MAG TPA: metallopeptidase TldD-related protein [Acidimicrobiales bacterium]|nr:metallopeptidase TldD-related protein [Acidimicrobiales bacterium]
MAAHDGLAPAHDVIEVALKASRAMGCVVIVEETSDAEVRFANNTMTTNGQRRSRRVTVVSVRDVSGGVASGVASRDGAFDVVDLVREAEVSAGSSTPSSDAADLAGGPVASDFAEPALETSLAIFDHIVHDLGGAFERAEDASTTLAGFVSHSLRTTYLGSSSGLRRRFVQRTGSFEMMSRAAGRASAWAAVGTPDFSGVTVAALEEELSRRLGWAQRSVDVEAGRYDVVLPPTAVGDFMGFLYIYAGGQDAEDGKTVFSKAGGKTRVGERLATLPFQLRSDPREQGIECAPFLAVSSSSPLASVFDNGIDLGLTKWLDDGRLNALQYHRAGAARSRVDFAGPIDNLALELPGAKGTVSDLVTATERGLLLTCLWYIEVVDPATLLLTGLTRDGVYVIEDGMIVGAANNFRFNQSPVDLLASAQEAGATVRTFSRAFGEEFNRMAMPPLRVHDFNMSTVSPAN